MIYVETHQNNLTKEFCNHVIKKFENDTNKVPGISAAGLDIKIKDSIDLSISQTDNYSWEEEDSIFYEALKDPLMKYLNNYVYPARIKLTPRTHDTGYQIQKTTPFQNGYMWHHDAAVEDNSLRIVTYIWYLNTVDEEGSTEFIDGTQIKPEQGKLILFPSFWTHIHKGNPPRKVNKYICTGWVWCRY